MCLPRRQAPGPLLPVGSRSAYLAGAGGSSAPLRAARLVLSVVAVLPTLQARAAALPLCRPLGLFCRWVAGPPILQARGCGSTLPQAAGPVLSVGCRSGVFCWWSQVRLPCRRVGQLCPSAEYWACSAGGSQVRLPCRRGGRLCPSAGRWACSAGGHSFAYLAGTGGGGGSAPQQAAGPVLPGGRSSAYLAGMVGSSAPPWATGPVLSVVTVLPTLQARGEGAALPLSRPLGLFCQGVRGLPTLQAWLAALSLHGPLGLFCRWSQFHLHCRCGGKGRLCPSAGRCACSAGGSQAHLPCRRGWQLCPSTGHWAFSVGWSHFRLPCRHGGGGSAPHQAAGPVLCVVTVPSTLQAWGEGSALPLSRPLGLFCGLSQLRPPCRHGGRGRLCPSAGRCACSAGGSQARLPCRRGWQLCPSAGHLTCSVGGHSSAYLAGAGGGGGSAPQQAAAPVLLVGPRPSYLAGVVGSSVCGSLDKANPVEDGRALV
ncbi:uncharacterized protein LOC131423562 [Marmota monax]|uniref:uncharacterized protein LOC131423562 n=1 Tax=Marmota monax TaxID=9995 RepID=UPI0026EB6446|nr:uncharacterized protein LOC131423562 [Marmota monax]